MVNQTVRHAVAGLAYRFLKGIEPELCSNSWSEFALIALLERLKKLLHIHHTLSDKKKYIEQKIQPGLLSLMSWKIMKCVDNEKECGRLYEAKDFSFQTSHVKCIFCLPLSII